MFEAVGSSWSWLPRFPSFRKQKKLEPYVPQAERELKEKLDHAEWVIQHKNESYQELWKDWDQCRKDRDALKKERDELLVEKARINSKPATGMNKYLAELYGIVETPNSIIVISDLERDL
jgi:hypothetical protein